MFWHWVCLPVFVKHLTCAKQHYNLDCTLANIPQDDPAVYEMISHADTIGVFQIESRAQQSMLPRLKPKTFYDLVIEVAIVTARAPFRAIWCILICDAEMGKNRLNIHPKNWKKFWAAHWVFRYSRNRQ